MALWQHFNIPKNLVGDIKESGNSYFVTYRTEILLPQNSQYAGYCFLHPSKLVSETKYGIQLSYTDDFTFVLTKRDREPGKRYKRYTLNAEELRKEYAKVIEQMEKQAAKKERARLSQLGTIFLAVYHCQYNQSGFKAVFLFQHNKKFYGSNGSVYAESKACWILDLKQSVSREQFESVGYLLDNILKEYHLLLSTRYTLTYSCERSSQELYSNSNATSSKITKAFISLCEELEKELSQELYKIFLN